MINDFDFAQPHDLGEALQILSQNPRAVLLAGGTNLMVNLKRRPLNADLVVDISRLLELNGIRNGSDEVELGPLVNFAQLLEWRPGGSVEELIRPTSAAFAGPLIRNLATIGGNICDASPAADISPPLLALDARVKLESRQRGARWLALPDFFQGVRKTARAVDELLTAIRFPIPGPDTQAFYYKLGKRRADAISIVSVAITGRVSGKRADNVRIALGAVAPVAMRTPQAEEILEGKELSEASIRKAARMAAKEVHPIDDFRASAAYRREMVEVLVGRGLRRIAGQS